MQTPQELLKRTKAARPRANPQPARGEEGGGTPGRKLVMNPMKEGVYRRLMVSHDRMRTRHLG